MTRSRSCVVALLATTVGLLAASPAHAGSWSNSYAFGATLKGDLYTPTTPAASPAILVAIHMCSGHSSTVHGWFDSFADQYGFYIIAPDAGKNCFDASAARSGDKAAVVTMVNYVITNKHADASRVFAAGMSSGGCMTNTLLAVYPDVFAGGSAMPGFPAGGWPAGDTSCTKCGSQPPNMSGAQWAAVATNVFKWSGEYGCSQQWVGGGDQYNFNGWLPAVVSQFQTLSNLGSGMSASGSLSGWTRTEYKDTAGNVRLQTNLGPSTQKHDLENLGSSLYTQVISFLGLDKPTGACGLSTSSTTGGGGTSGRATGGAGGAATGTGGHAGSSGMAGTGGHGTGGIAGTGGIKGTGGEATGGIVGTGGTTTTGTGGIIGTGGIVGTGGTTTTGTGGEATTGTGGDSGGNDSGGSGCSCAVRGGSTGTGPLLLLLGLAVIGTRRRR
jgi:poly(hydroxyalkanoate) depolymerase family esterase